MHIPTRNAQRLTPAPPHPHGSTLCSTGFTVFRES
jgi:hypothetical protein